MITFEGITIQGNSVMQDDTKQVKPPQGYKILEAKYDNATNLTLYVIDVL